MMETRGICHRRILDNGINMNREIISNATAFKADVFALGVTAIELVRLQSINIISS